MLETATFFDFCLAVAKLSTSFWTCLIEQKIKTALSYSGIIQAELAQRIGTTPSNLNQKVKRNTVTKEEMEQIAKAIGGTWRFEFMLMVGP